MKNSVAGYGQPAARIREVVDGQGQLTEEFGGFVVDKFGFEALFHPPETRARRHLLVRVAELAQQAADLVGASPGLADRLERRALFDPAGVHLLQQPAFEFPAMLRPPGITAAPAAVQ